jgi:hypothetical protein
MALARIDDKWIFPATSIVLPMNLSYLRSFHVGGKLEWVSRRGHIVDVLHFRQRQHFLHALGGSAIAMLS